MKKQFLAVFAAILTALSLSVSQVSAGQELRKLDIESVEASTTQTTDLPSGETDVSAKNLIDNNLSTRWSSEFSDNNWVLFKLKKAAKIKKVVIDWELSYAKEFKVLVSNDNKKWTEIYGNADFQGGRSEIEIEKAVSAKFLKILLIKRNTNWGFSIHEVRIEGN